ncbi:hypothetical protein LMG933_22670, partial [Xanthomonas euvesicatoria]
MTIKPLLLALVACAALPPSVARAAPAPSQATMTVAGLQRPAQIRVDRWGLAHIYAQTDDDAFFVQGFN